MNTFEASRLCGSPDPVSKRFHRPQPEDRVGIGGIAANCFQRRCRAAVDAQDGRLAGAPGDRGSNRQPRGAILHELDVAPRQRNGFAPLQRRLAHRRDHGDVHRAPAVGHPLGFSPPRRPGAGQQGAGLDLGEIALCDAARWFGSTTARLRSLGPLAEVTQLAADQQGQGGAIHIERLMVMPNRRRRSPDRRVGGAMTGPVTDVGRDRLRRGGERFAPSRLAPAREVAPSSAVHPECCRGQRGVWGVYGQGILRFFPSWFGGEGEGNGGSRATTGTPKPLFFRLTCPAPRDLYSP